MTVLLDKKALPAYKKEYVPAPTLTMVCFPVFSLVSFFFYVKILGNYGKIVISLIFHYLFNIFR